MFGFKIRNFVRISLYKVWELHYTIKKDLIFADLRKETTNESNKNIIPEN